MGALAQALRCIKEVLTVSSELRICSGGQQAFGVPKNSTVVTNRGGGSAKAALDVWRGEPGVACDVHLEPHGLLLPRLVELLVA